MPKKTPIAKRMRMQGRETTRARKWGERVAPKMEKKLSKIQEKAKSIPAADKKALAKNKTQALNTRGKLGLAKQAIVEKQVPMKRRMDTIAGRNTKGKRIATDNKIQIRRVAQKEISEVKKDQKLARKVTKRNRK